MPALLGQPSTREIAGICAGMALLASIGAWGYILWKRSRISPQEAERRRRLALNTTGKMGDAMLVEVHDDLVFYSYDVRGVEYTASQDVSTLRELLPDDPEVVNSVVFVKYDPRNPANSMILCEEWSGLRIAGQAWARPRKRAANVPPVAAPPA